MTPGFDIVMSMLDSVGLMALLSVILGTLLRTGLNKFQKSLVAGLLFGGGAVISMMSPMSVSPGVIVDGRSVMIGLGAAFGGIPAAIISAAIAGSYRAYLGGAGAVAGTTGIVLAAILGTIWARYFRPKGRIKVQHLLVVGVMISMQFVVVVFLFPYEIAVNLLTNVFPIYFLAAVTSAVILGTLIERERRLISSGASLKQAAENDFLTGLANRRYLQMAASDPDMPAESGSPRHTLVVLDLDHFKQINDKWGHDAGDRALVTFADILRQHSRAGDVVARQGGEEFAILMKDTSLPDAKNGMERILQATRSTIIEGPAGGFHLTVSAGMVEYRPAEESFSAAMSRADVALYNAKNAGRDQIKIARYSKAA
ncbi:MAG: diguanylate cyclase [Rhizobiaceae bacterium]|nr:diguanylate cyclase [Rhizobiaceae bacterium]